MSTQDSLNDVTAALMVIHKDLTAINTTLTSIQDILDDGLNAKDSYGQRGAPAISYAIDQLAEVMRRR